MSSPTSAHPAVGPLRWWLYGLALFGLFAAWALASPLFSVPDEPAHVVKAAAVVRGQLYGTPGVTDDGEPVVRVRVPARYRSAYAWPGCFMFDADATADCAPDDLAGGDADIELGTPAAGYPPLFYALVGWPSLVSADATAVHAMRLLSAALCAAMLAAGAWALSTVTGPRVAMAATLFVATPMAAFLAGSVNPNGLEIAAAVATWAAAVAGARRVVDGVALGRGLTVVLVVAGSTLALTRWLSPLYLLAILALVGVSVPLRSWRPALGRRDVRVVVGALGGAVVVAGALIALAPGRDLSPGPAVPDGVGALRALVGQTGQYVENMIGRFGWVDTPPPLVTELVWWLGTGALLGLAAVLADRLVLRAVALTAAATLVVPIAAQLPSTDSIGMPWQGRYTLPLAVGVLVLAVVGISGRAASGAEGVAAGRWRSAVVALAVAAPVGHAAAVAWALRRYVTGLQGSLDLLGDAAWTPPGGVAGVLTLTVVACAGAVACALVPARGTT